MRVREDDEGWGSHMRMGGQGARTRAGTRRGGVHTSVGTAAQIDELKQEIARRRQQRGYAPVAQPSG